MRFYTLKAELIHEIPFAWIRTNRSRFWLLFFWTTLLALWLIPHSLESKQLQLFNLFYSFIYILDLYFWLFGTFAKLDFKYCSNTSVIILQSPIQKLVVKDGGWRINSLQNKLQLFIVESSPKDSYYIHPSKFTPICSPMIRRNHKVQSLLCYIMQIRKERSRKYLGKCSKVKLSHSSCKLRGNAKDE